MEVINTLLANNLKAGQWPSMILIFKSANKGKKKNHISQEIKENFIWLGKESRRWSLSNCLSLPPSTEFYCNTILYNAQGD